MTAQLGENSYGKSGVRLLKVIRDGKRHELRDWTVAIALSGDFAAAHAQGDNSAVLPTDTMKNTVYAKARELAISDPESFAFALGDHFLAASGSARSATVSIAEHGWRRMSVAGNLHPHSFENAGNERRTTRVTVSRSGQREVVSGIADLLILKSAESAFSGYPRDKYTTLKETEDRILATSVTAQWTYSASALDFDAEFDSVRDTLLGTFANHVSKSVQHTLYDMGAAVIDQCPSVGAIHIAMPNKHHLLVDLSPFGLDNPNEIFVPTSEPYGLIEATVSRG